MKRLFDIALSAFCLVAFFPFFIVIALLIKLDSEGAILYRQERLGLNMKPFTILKFRTMHKYAEIGEPQLSTKDDKRITRIGTFLRKYRIDELPQLWNILVGEMSFVGPRPERKFYVDQIMKVAPEYAQLFTAKPGLSSWGMVKYGYASDIEQMIIRMRYDLTYIDNKSIISDLKIIIYTIKIVITGKGI